MHFNAIVHAPVLRPGARLNIAEADQVEGDMPNQLEVGAEVHIRFGVCCPDHSKGTVVALLPAPESVVLAIGSRAWTLLKGSGGINVPGLVSDQWYVAGEGTDVVLR